MKRNVKIAPTVRNPTSQYERENTRIVGELSTNELVNGVMLKDVTIAATSTRVTHRLGRPAIGFKVVDATADVRVWRDPAAVNAPDYMYLIASAPETVSLWVF
jgi:hypothetical protein